jgi:hypothetical protein
MSKNLARVLMNYSIYSFLAIISLLMIGGCNKISLDPPEPDFSCLAKLINQEIPYDQDLISEILTAGPGSKQYKDSDNDGKNDILYFVDDDPRHGESKQPLLVIVIDEDNDMNETGEGDKDSDLYLADWYSDGTIDRVIDYADLDSDNDVDEQYMIFEKDGSYFVAWAKDYGDDNKLWYDVNYEYVQEECQWLTDFNGDEMFVYKFRYNCENNSLYPSEEIAFSFYDLDDDNYSEEAIRFFGKGTQVKSLRYSMDLDNDNASSGLYHHDFDFSLSCIGEMEIPISFQQEVEIRGVRTLPIASWEGMKELAKEFSWDKIHLTWDENDNNVSKYTNSSLYERWEGVINEGNEFMPKVGGPSVGELNKRNEVDIDASGAMQFYYSPYDKRLHLFGADVGWIKVDFDNSSTVDMVIDMQDSDKDGFFDMWLYNLDGEDEHEDSVVLAEDQQPLISFDYQALHNIYIPQLAQTITLNSQLIEVLKKILMLNEPGYTADLMEKYFEDDLINFRTDFGLGKKIIDSAEGQIYYLDIIKTRYWQRFLQLPLIEDEYFLTIEDEYNSGNLDEVINLLENY